MLMTFGRLFLYVETAAARVAVAAVAEPSGTPALEQLYPNGSSTG